MPESKKEITSTTRSTIRLCWEEISQDETYSNIPNYNMDLYPNMFIEDIQHRIYPIGGNSRNTNFKVLISPENKNIEVLIAEAINEKRNPYRINDTLYDFFRFCAYSLIVYGEKYYEIAYNFSGDRIISFDLVEIFPYSIIKKRGKYYQRIPEKKAKENNLSREIELETENIIKFELPFKYSKIDFRKVLDKLAEWGHPRTIMPDYVLKELKEGKRKTPYDLKYSTRIQGMAIASLTKDIGWNVRGIYWNEALEYHWLHRDLLFYEFLISLREKILEDLNGVFKKVGDKMNFKASIIIEGLPTLEDIKTAKKQLEEGHTPFGVIMKPFQNI